MIWKTSLVDQGAKWHHGDYKRFERDKKPQSSNGRWGFSLRKDRPALPGIGAETSRFSPGKVVAPNALRAGRGQQD